ncbi:hypothetical protein GCM10027405_09620 [Arthrobacter alkaliphilus]
MAFGVFTIVLDWADGGTVGATGEEDLGDAERPGTENCGGWLGVFGVNPSVERCAELDPPDPCIPGESRREGAVPASSIGVARFAPEFPNGGTIGGVPGRAGRGGCAVEGNLGRLDGMGRVIAEREASPASVNRPPVCRLICRAVKAELRERMWPPPAVCAAAANSPPAKLTSLKAIRGAPHAKAIPTAPPASPANDFDSAKSLMATARTVAASGFAMSSATTISHHLRAQDFVFSHGMSIKATGATAASTMRANDRKIIEHIRMNARIQTTMTAMAVTMTAPAAPLLVPGDSDTTFHSRPDPSDARSKPKSRMNTTYGSVPIESRSASAAESPTFVSCRAK